jgi:hypothetical protein
MTQRRAFVVRVEPDGGAVTVEDIRASRVARLPSLATVGDQITRWLATEPPPAQPLTDSAGASPQSCSKR